MKERKAHIFYYLIIAEGSIAVKPVPYRKMRKNSRSFWQIMLYCPRNQPVPFWLRRYSMGVMAWVLRKTWEK